MMLTAPVNLRPQSARWLSVLVLAALAGGYLIVAMLPDAGPPVSMLLGLVRLFGLIGAFVLFIDSHGQQANAPDAMLDERQRGERDRAYVRSYQIILGSLFLVLIYTLPVKFFGWQFPDRDAGIDLLSAFAIAGLALPGIILAWRAREDEGELG